MIWLLKSILIWPNHGFLIGAKERHTFTLYAMATPYNKYLKYSQKVTSHIVRLNKTIKIYCERTSPNNINRRPCKGIHDLWQYQTAATPNVSKLSAQYQIPSFKFQVPCSTYGTALQHVAPYHPVPYHIIWHTVWHYSKKD